MRHPQLHDFYQQLLGPVQQLPQGLAAAHAAQQVQQTADANDFAQSQGFPNLVAMDQSNQNAIRLQNQQLHNDLYGARAEDHLFSKVFAMANSPDTQLQQQGKAMLPAILKQLFGDTTDTTPLTTPPVYNLPHK